MFILLLCISFLVVVWLGILVILMFGMVEMVEVVFVVVVIGMVLVFLLVNLLNRMLVRVRISRMLVEIRKVLLCSFELILCLVMS